MNTARFAALMITVLVVCPAYGQEAPSTPQGATAANGDAGELPFSFDGPPPPSPPAVIARDESGRATLRAVRLTSPLRLDGVLDESMYSTVPPISDFLQMEPLRGVAATEKTELWVSFDRDHVYISFRCWESGMDRIVANEMRRDNPALWQGNDIVGFMFDSFYDRQNSALFSMNSIGGRNDGQVTNERQYAGDWNPIWSFKTARFEEGWTLEASVPFKSLRYRPGRAQIWGFNALRTNRWKNEISMLTLGASGRGQQGIQNASMAATLVGIEAPAGSNHLEIKPYVVSELKTDRNAVPRLSNEVSAKGGVDVKYGITQNITADFTYNTDFAQVEADEQQVNLTRFGLFFPEKREFFLENQGVFSFGGATSRPNEVGDTPILFHSRRIGLNEGRLAPIQGGARVTGRLQRYSFGLLNIRTGEDTSSNARPTNFSVARVKRDILRKSSIGALFTGRSVRQSGVGKNAVYGVDGTFSFFENLAFNTYWAKSESTGVSRGNSSYRTQMDYSGDRYGVQVERLVVGDNFNPEVGYVRRDDMRRTYGQVRFSPRPQSIESVRKFSWIASMNHVENHAGKVETREADGEFAVEFQNSDRLAIGFRRTEEFLPRPFTIAGGLTLAVRDYTYDTGRVSFNMGPQRRFSTQVTAEHGTFYDGHRTAFSFGRSRMNVSSRLSVEPTYSVNWVNLAQGSFTTQLLGSRITYTITPLMFTSALVQYNSGVNAMTANIRFRWEYRPGSELFVVYNEERDTRGLGYPELSNRALIVKATRLVRF